MHPYNAKNSQKVNQVKITFTNKSISAWGGIASIISKYFEQINFQKWIESAFPIEEKSPNSKGIYPKVLSLFLTVLCGGYRFNHMEWWGHGKEVLKRTFNIGWLPESSTALTRFWNNIKTQSVSRLWGKNAKKISWELIKKEGIEEDNINLDSTILTRYGEQEGAKKGYNPKKKGRNSHHPLLAFLGKGYVVNLWNREGTSHSNSQAVDFLKETFLHIPENFKIRRILADPGFYQIQFIEYLEKEGLIYIIRAPLQPILQKQIQHVTDLEEVSKGISVGTFYFQHNDEKWKKDRKYVVIRQNKTLRKKALGKQLSLFPEFEEDENYVYNLMITNDETIKPVEVWHEYRPRANDENVIKDLKEGYGLAAFSLDNFWATESVMVANSLVLHNLIHFLNRNVLNKNKSIQQLKTLRKKYFIIPASLGKWGRDIILRIGIQNKKLRAKFKYFLSQIQQINITLSKCIAFEEKT